MAISFSCQECGKTLSVRDEFAGKRGKCPDCQAVVSVPLGVSKSPATPTRPQAAASSGGVAAAQRPPASRAREDDEFDADEIGSANGGATVLVRVVEDVTKAHGFRLTTYDTGEIVIEKGNFPLSCVLGAIAPYSRFLVKISTTSPGMHQYSLSRNTPWWTGFIGVSQVRKKFDRLVEALVETVPRNGGRVVNHRLEKTTAEITVALDGRYRQVATTKVCPMCAEDIEASSARCRYCDHRF